MKTLGLLGGVASGKSVVARKLRQLGATVLDADAVGHDVLRLPYIKEAVRERFGASIFGPDGEIVRHRLAAIVFPATDVAREELAYLEKLTHPEIGRRLREQLNELEKKGTAVAVLDAPVMLKAGWDQFCDQIWFIDAPYEVRLARCRARGWSEDQFRSREMAQEPLEQKRELADLVLDNSGDIGYTHQQIERFWPSLFG